MSKVGLGSTTIITVSAGVTMVLALVGMVTWLDFLYLLSYIKLSLTVVKYIPQVYMNYKRKSTTGWSIINVMLDFTGGVFSITQIILDCIISGSGWDGIKGFMIKMALGVVTLFFDTIFLLQHYVWFPEGPGPHVIEVQDLDYAKGPAGPEAEMDEVDVAKATQQHELKSYAQKGGHMA